MSGGFRHLGEEVVHRGYAMEVVVARFQGPDGKEFSRDVLRHVGAVGVLPLHDDATVTLVRQYRAPLDRTVLEIPAGLRDVQGEALATTAHRELAEEAGLAADRIEPLCSFHNAVGHSDEEVHVFLATGLRPVDTAAQGPEEHAMQIERLAVDDVVGMIRAGEISDSKTIISVLLTRV